MLNQGEPPVRAACVSAAEPLRLHRLGAVDEALGASWLRSRPRGAMGKWGANKLGWAAFGGKKLGHPTTKPEEEKERERERDAVSVRVFSFFTF